ncbi:MAG: ABC transporter permease [Candidatus Dadabacteria bacterium]|nr:MAG: ABC transporter permease [Candidatus Dadabacteria bacterium]
MNSKIWHVARKELAAYFSSPVAFIFLGTFLFINLFIFFWVETFFARNIADVRPLFEWMPVLLIFLVSSLTMRMWSEERRMGTLEFLLTLPVNTLDLVLGKFVACMTLVVIALLLTLPLPVTVSFLGNLDWGPVIGGYIATIFLAAAYVSIGLYVSARSDNQIVSLIGTFIICGIFYGVGSDAISSLFGTKGAEILKLIGTGSRFESITRGVIDIRDIYYYLSLVGIFFTLNIYSLEKLKWSEEKSHSSHKRWRNATLLMILNFALANVWLTPVYSLRADMTQGGIYSISDATRNYLNQLQEPLLIRGYFSAKTHPLLAPLVPQLRDLIREYEIAGHGKVRAEFVDPREDPKLEEEAAQKYNIKPVPFQVADKYQASLVNSYFDIVVQYGDKFEVLNFRDLIDLYVRSEDDINVELRNPEYDITRAIKKVLYGFQSTENLFASLKKPVTFIGYVSDDSKLPEALREFRIKLQDELTRLTKIGGDKFDVEFVDPDANGGKAAKEIMEKYGFQPMVAGLLDPNQFYFYMILKSGEQVLQIPLPADLDAAGARRSIEAGLKRFSHGFLKTVGVYAPPVPTPPNPMMARFMPPGKTFNLLKEKLQENFTVDSVDLKNGVVPEDVDVLLLLSPEGLDQKQLFAVDQFLMKGGTVILSTAPFHITQTRQNISAEDKKSGLEDWLKHNGITFEKKLILDPQNESYPVPIRHKVGAFTVEEIKLIRYPFFVDVRGEGLNRDNMITSGITQVTINWPSPLKLKKDNKHKITWLLKSSPKSIATTSTQIKPDFQLYPELGFPMLGEEKARVIGGIVEGSFESFFKGKKSPLLEEKKPEENKKDDQKQDKKEKKPVITGVIDKSPDSARIIVYASNEFLADATLRISATKGTNRFINSLQLMENTLDWSVEDRGLLSIRNRGHFTRTLKPLEKSEQMFWEYLNYAMALAGLLIVFGIYRTSRNNVVSRYQQILQPQGA